MKIIFFSNGSFLFDTVKKIETSKHEILCAVSEEPTRKGRGLLLKNTLFADFIIQANIPILLNSKLNDQLFIEKIKKLKADIFIVADYKIIPDKIFNIPKYGCINLHPSLLPKYKGAAPIQRSIMNGDTILGLSTFIINERIDSGKLISQEKITFNDKCDFEEIYNKLSKLGSKLILRSIDMLKENIFDKSIYNHEESYAKKIQKEELKIDFNLHAKFNHNKIRALSYIGCYAYINRKRIKFFDSYYLDKKHNLKIGEYKYKDKYIEIACKNSILLVKQIQIEGKKKISAHEFINNNNLNSPIIE